MEIVICCLSSIVTITLKTEMLFYFLLFLETLAAHPPSPYTTTTRQMTSVNPPPDNAVRPALKEKLRTTDTSPPHHHPCSNDHGCSAFGIVARPKYGYTACALCDSGRRYHMCCGAESASAACSVTAAARKRGIVWLQGRWNSTAHGVLSIAQKGRTVSVLCPNASWSPTCGTAQGEGMNVFSQLATLTDATLHFQDGDVWTREGDLDPAAERLRWILAEFFATHDAKQACDVDWLVERYSGRKEALRNYLLEQYRENLSASSMLDTLFGTGPKWWTCTLCHNVMNAAVFSLCAVCGCEQNTPRPKRTDDASLHFSYDHSYAAQGIAPREAPHPPIPDKAELIHQLSPALLSLGVLQADVHHQIKRGWSDALPVATEYIAARRGRPQGCRATSPHLARLGGSFPSSPVLRTEYNKGDAVMFAIRGVPHQATVIFVVEVAPVVYIIQLPDGTEVSCSAEDLTHAVPRQRQIPAADDRGLPSWHAATLSAGLQNARSRQRADSLAATMSVSPGSRSEQDDVVLPTHDALALLNREAGLVFSESEEMEDTVRTAPTGGSPSSVATSQGFDTEGVWICFDCDYKANTADTTDCAACGKRRNVGSWQRFKQREQNEANLNATHQPAPARVYTPPREPDAFQAFVVALHNKRRGEHRAQPLAYSLNLALHAQKQAEVCARLIGVTHGNNDGEGQNTFMSGTLTTFNARRIAEIACDTWYAEKGVYESSPGLLGLRNGAGHFTQMVWKATRSMGCGIAWAGSRAYVVVNYFPPGNDTSDPVVLSQVTLPV